MRRYKCLPDFMTVEEKGQIICPSSPYRPIWVQYGEVAFSVNCFTASYSPIWIQFGLVHLDPSAFDDTKVDEDWFKLTLPSGIKIDLA